MTAMGRQPLRQNNGWSAALLPAAAVLAARALLAPGPLAPAHYLAAHSHDSADDHGSAHGHAAGLASGIGLIGTGATGIPARANGPSDGMFGSATHAVGAAAFIALARCIWALAAGKRRGGGGLKGAPGEVLLSAAQAAFFGIAIGRVGALR